MINPDALAVLLPDPQLEEAIQAQQAEDSAQKEKMDRLLSFAKSAENQTLKAVKTVQSANTMAQEDMANVMKSGNDDCSGMESTLSELLNIFQNHGSEVIKSLNCLDEANDLLTSLSEEIFQLNIDLSELQKETVLAREKAENASLDYMEKHIYALDTPEAFIHAKNNIPESFRTVELEQQWDRIATQEFQLAENAAETARKYADQANLEYDKKKAAISKIKEVLNEAKISSDLSQSNIRQFHQDYQDAQKWTISAKKEFQLMKNQFEDLLETVSDNASVPVYGGAAANSTEQLGLFLSAEAAKYAYFSPEDDNSLAYPSTPEDISPVYRPNQEVISPVFSSTPEDDNSLTYPSTPEDISLIYGTIHEDPALAHMSTDEDTPLQYTQEASSEHALADQDTPLQYIQETSSEHALADQDTPLQYIQDVSSEHPLINQDTPLQYIQETSSEHALADQDTPLQHTQDVSSEHVLADQDTLLDNTAFPENTLPAHIEESTTPGNALILRDTAQAQVLAKEAVAPTQEPILDDAALVKAIINKDTAPAHSSFLEDAALINALINRDAASAHGSLLQDTPPEHALIPLDTSKAADDPNDKDTKSDLSPSISATIPVFAPLPLPTAAPDSTPETIDIPRDISIVKISPLRSFIKACASALFSFILIFGAITGIFLVIFNVAPINSVFMHNTLHKGDILLINKWAYKFSTPQRDDIIQFNTANNAYTIIERIIGLPNEHIYIKDGIVLINGKQSSEYNLFDIYTEGDINIVVPEGHYFVLGDNRPDCQDSRSENIGTIPLDSIDGKAFFNLCPDKLNKLLSYI